MPKSPPCWSAALPLSGIVCAVGTSVWLRPFRVVPARDLGEAVHPHLRVGAGNADCHAGQVGAQRFLRDIGPAHGIRRVQPLHGRRTPVARLAASRRLLRLPPRRAGLLPPRRSLGSGLGAPHLRRPQLGLWRGARDGRRRRGCDRPAAASKRAPPTAPADARHRIELAGGVRRWSPPRCPMPGPASGAPSSRPSAVSSARQVVAGPACQASCWASTQPQREELRSACTPSL